MLPSEVNNLTIKDSTEFQKNGTLSSVRVYTFFIGEHGPFIEKFYAGEQDTPAIERRIGDRVAQLRELGAIPQK
jgi:hypothetical protein